MLTLNLSDRLREGGRVLCIGAHCDDIDIGCGGTLLTWLADCPGIHVDWVVLSGSELRAAEARASAARLLADAASSEIRIGTFRDGFFPAERVALKEYFEELKALRPADVVLTHYRQDLHQDHRMVNELTWNTFRNHLILEYEIPKYDGDLGQPNAYVAVSEGSANRKVEILMESFASESGKDWFDGRTFAALLRLRGIESRAASGLAEAFYCRKLRL